MSSRSKDAPAEGLATRAAAARRLERFFDLHAPIYDATRPILLRGRSRAVEMLGVRPGDSVLELACGTGLNFPHLRRAGAGRITGVDLSARMLERAHRRDPQARLVRGDFAALDFGERFPRALCAFALSLLPHPVEVARAMRRHLTADGVLVILDFGELEGGRRVFSPLWRGWLGGFGARTDLLARRAELSTLFEECSAATAAGGMAAMLRLARPT
jgi:S-adenosylmethionine-diacylgycerolhomoserine-N-methlytransferase